MLRSVLALLALLAGLLVAGCSGDDSEDSPPPDAAVATDDGTEGASGTSRETGVTRSASAAVPDFRLTVLRDGCTVQRRVLPPDARIKGLRWQVEGPDGKIHRAPAVGEVYREPRAGRWRVSLTLDRGRGRSREQVTRPHAVRC